MLFIHPQHVTVLMQPNVAAAVAAAIATVGLFTAFATKPAAAAAAPTATPTAKPAVSDDEVVERTLGGDIQTLKEQLIK